MDKENEQWSAFVSNMMKEIHYLTKSSQWLYVSGQLNSANLPFGVALCINWQIHFGQGDRYPRG